MVYLNSAATSYPKPREVLTAVGESLTALPSQQFRGAGIACNADLFPLCRKRLGQILGIKDADRIFFSSGATEGLNCIIKGLGLPASAFVTTAVEHNSVLRPLYNLDRTEPVIVPCDDRGIVAPMDIEKAISAETKAVIVNHCSNVTGAVQDAKRIGEIAHAHDCLFILDCSQSAGCVEIDAAAFGADALVFTGHKSLMSVQGTGGFYVRRGVSVAPLKYGGTGRDSSIIRYSEGDREYEVGTQNSTGIAALSAAADYILSLGVRNIHRRENELVNYLLKELDRIENVHVFGRNLERRGPVVSIGIEGIKPADAAYILQNSYDIITRSGLMCAPLIHKYIGSGRDGTLRLSLSHLTTENDLDRAIEGIRDIAAL